MTNFDEVEATPVEQEAPVEAEAVVEEAPADATADAPTEEVSEQEQSDGSEEAA
jgi:hypothetical protein